MARTQKDLILEYYQRELSYLRREGAAFSQKYPKIAKRLELNQGDALDPHVERLLEGVAYLTAKINKELDDQLPHVGSALLNTIYPQFSNLIPAATILSFDMSSFRGSMTECVTIPRHTEVFSEAHDGTECYFRTIYATDVWPVEIQSVEILRRENTFLKPHEMPCQRVMKIRIGALSTPLSDLSLTSLRFFIQGEQNQQDRIYELLFKDQAPVVIECKDENEDSHRHSLPQGSLHSVGFESEETAFPYEGNTHSSYQLLLEYFHFRQKFYFFDIKNISPITSQQYFDLYIGLADTVLFDIKNIRKNTLCLGCSPAVNIFSKTSEPLLFDHKASEYRLVADHRRDKTTEIHSISNVFSLKETDETPTIMYPYYSYQHGSAIHKSSYFWHAKRRAITHRDTEGYDFYLSFLDENFDPRIPFEHTVYAEVLCTNRNLTQYISSGTLFQCPIEQPAPQIVSLIQPTPTVYPSEEGSSLWRLIAHLSINHLGFSSEKKSLEALKEILRLYAYTGENSLIPEVESILEMKTHTIVRRTRFEAWRGFVHGTQVEFVIKDQTQGSLFLFMTVLQRFLSAQASMNSFIEVCARHEHKNDTWHTWQPTMGSVPLL